MKYYYWWWWEWWRQLVFMFIITFFQLFVQGPSKRPINFRLGGSGSRNNGMVESLLLPSQMITTRRRNYELHHFAKRKWVWMKGFFRITYVSSFIYEVNYKLCIFRLSMRILLLASIFLVSGAAKRVGQRISSESLWIMRSLCILCITKRGREVKKSLVIFSCPGLLFHSDCFSKSVITVTTA